MTDNKVPHVYTAVAKVLSALRVDKNGVLPGNMGGKSYITAVDISAEVKRQFVDNNLVLFSNEDVTHQEVLIEGTRRVMVIGIRGSYTIVSTEDGSNVTISGVGDGSAIGTSVASNIASTNALKNALLRTFLITEQSVEDQAKNGDSDSKSEPSAVSAAKASKPTPAVKSSYPTKDKIKADYIDSGKVTLQRVQEEVQKAQAGGLKGEDAYKAVLKVLEKDFPA